MEQKLRVGIIGAGKAGSELHFDAYKKIKEVEVVALIERDVERAAKVAKEKGIPKVYGSIEEAIKVEKFDIVSICTPPVTHFEIAKTLIANNINFLLEKPILSTIEEADVIDGLLKTSSVKCSAIHQQKFLPGYAKAAEMTKAGEFGEIHKVDVVWMVNGYNNYMTRDPEFWCHKLPGGRWQEMIAHPLYKVMQVTGPLELDHVSMRNVRNNWPWMPSDEVEVIYKSKTAYVTIKLSVNNENKDYNYMMIYGAKKLMYVDNIHVIDLLDKLYTPAPPKGLLSIIKERISARFGGSSTSNEPEVEVGHIPIIRKFVAYVKGQVNESPVSWQEAYLTHKLVLQTGEGINALRSKV